MGLFLPFTSGDAVGLETIGRHSRLCSPCGKLALQGMLATRSPSSYLGPTGMQKYGAGWSPSLRLVAELGFAFKHLCPEDVRAWLAFTNLLEIVPGGPLKLEQWTRLCMMAMIKWPYTVSFLASLAGACWTTPEGLIEITHHALEHANGKRWRRYHDTHNRKRVYTQSGLMWFARHLQMTDKVVVPETRKRQKTSAAQVTTPVDALRLGKCGSMYTLSDQLDFARTFFEGLCEACPKDVMWPVDTPSTEKFLDTMHESASQGLQLQLDSYNLKCMTRKIILALPGDVGRGIVHLRCCVNILVSSVLWFAACASQCPHLSANAFVCVHVCVSMREGPCVCV